MAGATRLELATSGVTGKNASDYDLQLFIIRYIAHNSQGMRRVLIRERFNRGYGVEGGREEESGHREPVN